MSIHSNFMKSIVTTILLMASACTSPSEDDLIALTGAEIAITTVNGPLGNSALAFSPLSYSFGSLAANSGSASKNITVTNTSAFTIYLSAVTGISGDLSLIGNTCTNGLVMQPNAICQISLHYAPTSAGAFSTAVSIAYSDTPASSAYSSSIAISGAGTTLTGFAGLASLDTITTTTMKLHWADVTGADSYQVYSISAGGGSSLVASLPATSACVAGACSYIATGLTAATTQTFRVRATDASAVQESNIVNQSAITQNLGTFTAIGSLAANENANAQTPSLSCTDTYGSTNLFSITSQSDSTATCSLTATTGTNAKVSCTPAYHATGGTHSSWTNNVTVQCAMNGTNYSRTFAVNVSNTNRAPVAVLGSVTNPNPIATFNTTTFAATDSNTSGTTDIDGDQIHFSCTYTGGAVGATPTNCSSLPGTYSLGTTSGLFSWLPSIAASTSISPTVYSITITEDDLQSSNHLSTVTTSISVQRSVALATVTNRTFESGKTSLRVGTTFSNTFNNIQEQPTPGVTNMSYTCYFDQTPDGAVANTVACSTLSGLSFAQGNTTGVFSFTPADDKVGPYEFKVCGTISSGASSCQIFVIDVSSAYTTTNLVGYWDVMFTDLKAMLSGSLSSLQNLSNAGISSNFTTDASSSATPASSGSGTVASPLALNLNGNRSTSYHMAISAGTAYNSQSSIAIEQWINPASTTDSNAAIVSNSISSNGISIRQTPQGDGKLQMSVGKTYSSVVLSDSPMIYYRGDETSGTIANDSSGNATTYPGTYAASSGTLTLNQTSAFAYDADPSFKVASGARLFTPPISIPTGGFSLETWVKFSTISSQNSIFSIGPQSGAQATFYWLFYNSGGSFSLQAGPGVGYQYLSSSGFTAFAVNTWHHVVLTIDYSTKTAKIYVDGNTTPVMNQVYTDTPAVGSGTAQSIYFGDYIGGSLSTSGWLDEVAVYPSALTSAQVAAHYAARNNPTCTSIHPLLANTWNHVVGYQDNNSAALGLFINGVSECSVVHGATIPGETHALTYGSDPNMANPWNGKLAESRVYNPTNITAINSLTVGNFNATKDRYGFSSTPSSISNLQLWMKADSLALADGAAVGTWTDSSANSYTATQSVAGQKPIFKTNIVNGLPVVRFNSASSQYLDLGYVLGKPANFTTFAVYMTTDAVTRQDAFGSIDSTYTGARGWGLLDLNNGAAGILVHGWNSDGSSTGWARTSGAVISANTFYYTDSVYVSGSASAVPFVNGTTPAYGVSGAGATTNSGTPYSFSLGRAGAYNGNYFSGDLAEVIIYNKALSNAERARVEAYLKQKYGL